MKQFFLFISFVLQASSSFALLPASPALEKSAQAVVFLKISGPDADGSLVDGLCNGTLISNETLVTAAHCLAGSFLDSNHGGKLKLEIGEYKYKQRPDGTTYRTGYLTTLKHETSITAQFANGVSFNSPPNQISPENDFVLIRLLNALSLPADFEFAKLWKQSLTGFQISHPTVISINPIEYISSSDTKQFAELNQIKFSNYSAQSQSRSRVAPGDSGAPLFATINGQVYIIGVTKGRAETAFSNWDVFAIWGNRL